MLLLSSRLSSAIAVPASLESSAGTAPSVLLIEEYDALAAAITSALKKFAPQHRTHVVRSFAEADAAGQIEPQLLIVDFDPPQQDAIDFFDRFRPLHPDVRVLAIASGLPPDFAVERYGPCAIHFVEKPFELADFGAAVQALLGPWTAAKSGNSRGTLRDLNLRDLIPLQCVNAVTSVLKIKGSDGRAGEIHFVEGQIRHAAAPGLSGTDALHELLRWRDTHSREAPGSSDAPRTIHGPWGHIFVEAMRATKERGEPAETVARPAKTTTTKPRPKVSKKLLIIDDTEMLLIFVEDALSVADPSLQIVTTLTGTEGLRRAEMMTPDLILVDYSLPDLRGDHICERLLENETTARIPIIMMSGHVPEMMSTAERFENVVATIAKPFVSEALVRLVNETLGKGPLKSGPRRKRSEASSAPSPEEPSPAPPAPKARGNGKTPVASTVTSESAQTVVERPIPPPPPPPSPLPIPLSEKPVVRMPTTPPVESSAAVETVAPAFKPVAPPPVPMPRDVRPVEPSLLGTPPPAARRLTPAKVATPNGNAVILGFGMQVTSVQFTPSLQVGTIRVRPSATTASLLPPAGGSLPQSMAGVNFELGPAELDSQGRIKVLHVLPKRGATELIKMHNGFAIGDVALVKENACVEILAGHSAPMTIQLAARFKVAGVELSDRFEVARIVLLPEGNNVSVVLDPKSRGGGGTPFETVHVALDSSARIAEFVLNSAGREGN